MKRTVLAILLAASSIPGCDPPSPSAQPQSSSPSPTVNAGPAITSVADITATAASTSPATRTKPFDATLYKDKPLDVGMDETLLLPSGNFAFWIANKRLAKLGTIDGMWDDADKLTTVAKAAWDAGYNKFCMDDEGGDNQRILRNIAVIRRAAPDMKIGVFCYPQSYFNWSPERMRSVNDRADIKAILKELDFAVPGTDLRWDISTPEGRKSWLTFLKLIVAESDRAMPGKPCYPFLPFEYNPVVKTGELTNDEMNWQLDQVAALNRTPIIWGGWTKEWNENIPWHHGAVKTK